MADPQIEEAKNLTQPITDSYGRPVKSLRISLTQRCDFNCFFCHQEGEHSSLNELTLEELKLIAKIASEHGIKYIKLTGGEPLLREDILDIVREIKPFFDEISMTTNASRLKEYACLLKEAGLSRVNISLHSLNPIRFKEITGVDRRDVVELGIREAIRCGLNPVKLNMVVMRGVNHDEIEDLIKYSRETGAILQLIEFQELEKGKEYYDNLHYDLVPLEETLKERSDKIIEREMHRRKIYFLKNGAQVEVVRPMHNSTFCKYCTRMRVTSDGEFKPCLMRNDNHVPFALQLREGASYTKVVEAFKEAVRRREPYWKE